MMASKLKRILKEDNISKLKQSLRELRSLQLEVGIFGDGGFYSMLANVHEFGLTVNASGSFLPIPTPEAGDRKPSDIPGLFRPKNKQFLAVQDGEELKVLFVLEESITVPELSFMRSTYDEKLGDWQMFIANRLKQVIDGKMTGKKLLQMLGEKIQSDIQKKITSSGSLPSSPQAASIPLTDSSGLRQRVTWKVS